MPHALSHAEWGSEAEVDFGFNSNAQDSYQYEEAQAPIVEVTEEEPEGVEPYHEDGVSETESVLTLYLSRQGDTMSPSEQQQEELKEEAIHFTPANDEFKGERAKTAPPRPSTELEELRASKQFLNLEAAAIAGSQLIQKSDGKFDLDSPEGQKNCKNFLQELEKLFDSFKVPQCSRHYRNKFSQAYRVLYKEGSLCYLTEILDSAQEGTINEI